ncbi:Antirestriction protein ArdC [Thermoanaerobacter thermohydrosulfuricus]|nr:Antirestriction protein ArdC [Thermoanaerobacter thermohydrosulfuricus]
MSNKVYKIVTEKIIKKLQEGIIPWKQGWIGNPPINYITRKPYRGINRLLLSKGGEYLTFNQIEKLKGKIKKGSKAEIVIFYKIYEKTVTKINENGEEIQEVKRFPVLRYYNIFHISDVEGIPSKLQKIQHNPIQEAEKAIAGYTDRPPIIHDDPNTAAYYPIRDIINVPAMEYFEKGEEYYSTLFHELIHSTGHQKRLKRFTNDIEQHIFGSESYSKEELIAEIGAAMLCEHVGILNSTINNNVAYIQAWLEKLNSNEKLIIQAANEAQKAVDYILNVNNEENEKEEEEEGGNLLCV